MRRRCCLLRSGVTTWRRVRWFLSHSSTSAWILLRSLLGIAWKLVQLMVLLRLLLNFARINAGARTTLSLSPLALPRHLPLALPLLFRFRRKTSSGTFQRLNLMRFRRSRCPGMLLYRFANVRAIAVDANARARRTRRSAALLLHGSALQAQRRVRHFAESASATCTRVRGFDPTGYWAKAGGAMLSRISDICPAVILDAFDSAIYGLLGVPVVVLRIFVCE